MKSVIAALCEIWETGLSALTDRLIAKAEHTDSENLQKIIYIETGPFGPTERYIIDLEEERITYEFSGQPWEINDENYKMYELKKEKVREIKQELSGFSTKKWKEFYTNRKLNDGTFWRLLFLFAGGTSRKIIGINAWPKDFRRLGLSQSSDEWIPVPKEKWTPAAEPSAR